MLGWKLSPTLQGRLHICPITARCADVDNDDIPSPSQGSATQDCATAGQSCGTAVTLVLLRGAESFDTCSQINNPQPGHSLPAVQVGLPMLLCRCRPLHLNVLSKYLTSSPSQVQITGSSMNCLTQEI
jgi:hypothetical protein